MFQGKMPTKPESFREFLADFENKIMPGVGTIQSFTHILVLATLIPQF